MKQILLFLVALVVTGGLSSCKEEGPHKEDVVKFTAAISGSNTVPSVASNAQGTGIFEYDKSTRVLKYNITFQNIVPTSISIHKAYPAWEAGDRVVDIALPSSGSQTSGTLARPLTVSEQTSLISGNMYINIRSDEFIYGGARGQIIADENQ